MGRGEPARSRRKTYRHAIYVEWSHGIGAGLILDGELYRGAGIAGELGHTIVVDDAPRCPRCGNPGCLDSLAGWEAISAEIEGAPDLSSALGMARSGHAGARRAFEDAAERMGRALGPLITVLNPELVIFGGSVGQQGYDVIKSPLLHALKRFTMRPALKDVEVVAALLHDRTVLRGAMALVLRAGKGGADPLVSYLQRRATELGDPALAARGRATEG
jgi:predicted NBD/HSP70 family sugar kinase